MKKKQYVNTTHVCATVIGEKLLKNKIHGRI